MSKRKRNWMVVLWILATINVILLLFASKVNAATYPETLRVISIESKGDYDEIVCVNANDHIFAFFEESNDYEVGDLVSCTMVDRDTKEISDDEIVDPYYSGWHID